MEVELGAEEDFVTPEPDLPLAVLYADAHLVAIDKPAGVPSHPLHAGERGTLANALVARFPECAGAGDDRREAGLGHRLDNGTSGVILAARRHDVWLALRAALKAPSCEKSYLAEVIGRPSAARGSVREPIGRRGRRGSRGWWAGRGGTRCRPRPSGRSSTRARIRRCCACGCTPAARTRCARTWRHWDIRWSAIACTATGPSATWQSGWARRRCGCTPNR